MLSNGGRVLCVTHQAQIARFADHHFAVEKTVQNGRTITTAKKLDAAERVGDLARMIRESEDVSTACDAVRWLLDNADMRGLRSRQKRWQKKS